MNIRMLTEEDLPIIEALSTKKLASTKTSEHIFTGTGILLGSSGLVFKHFVLPDSTIGSQRMRCFGYFTDDRKLIGVIGIRNQDYQPSWVLSFIITDVECDNSIQVIKSLMSYVVEHQESKGMFQWFVISKLEKFKVWQKLFGGARSNYHHYVYARVVANTMPKWLNILQLSGNKLFPYDINVSMYVSKKLCTHNDPEDADLNFDESDLTFL